MHWRNQVVGDLPQSLRAPPDPEPHVGAGQSKVFPTRNLSFLPCTTGRSYYSRPHTRRANGPKGEKMDKTIEIKVKETAEKLEKLDAESLRIIDSGISLLAARQELDKKELATAQ